MIKELNYFLDLQVELSKKYIINQLKYIKDLEKSKMEDIKTMKTLMSLFIKLDKDEQGQSINHTLL